jgi:hypothetical protein
VGKGGEGGVGVWLTFAVRIPRTMRYAASLAEQTLRARHGGGSARRGMRGAANHAEYHYASALQQRVQAWAKSRDATDTPAEGIAAGGSVPAGAEEDVQSRAREAAASSAPTDIRTCWQVQGFSVGKARIAGRTHPTPPPPSLAFCLTLASA